MKYYLLKLLTIVVLVNIFVWLINTTNDFAFYGALICLSGILYTIYLTINHLIKQQNK